MRSRLHVAILGSGLIGSDLLAKVRRTRELDCVLFAGRNSESAGLRRAATLGVPTSAGAIDAVLESSAELVFDATSAADHAVHAPALSARGIYAVDMTPSNLGAMCVPAVNLEDCLQLPNVNMVSCGGQASIPLAAAVAASHDEVEYVEVVSSIASKSAGPATRRNLDEYVGTTEAALRRFSGAARAKAILIVNPAEPCVDMQTTLYAQVARPRLAELTAAVERIVRRIQEYVPGYRLLVPPVLDGERLVMTVRVQGAGDFLPSYAGNLDIINCAAIATARSYARAA